MKNIVFYISDHGFGHMSRNIPIIRKLLSSDSAVRVHIKCGPTQLEFAKSNLTEYNNRIVYYPERMDVGLVLKPGTLLVDKPALTVAIKEFTDSWNQRIAREVAFLRSRHIEKAIVDIPAWTLKACKLAGVPSLFISNFTWAETYREHLPHKLWQKYLDCYKLADKALLYDLHPEVMETYFQQFKTTGFLCREFHPEAAAAIRAEHSRPIVFVSVGRSASIKEEPFVGNLPYDFILTDGLTLVGDNVTYLPKDTENTQDYILASDFVIAKAGWGTIAETLLAGKKLALLSRDSIAEDRQSIGQLVKRNLAVEVAPEELVNMKDVLDSLEHFKFADMSDITDCTNDIVNEILG